MSRFSTSRFRSRRPWATILSVGAILCGVSSAQVAGAKNAGIVPPAVSSAWSFTDLDGDQQADVVRSTALGPEGFDYRYTIEFEMSAGRLSQSISIRSADSWGLHVTSSDLDGDNDLDLLVTGGAEQRPLGVWTNDGNGHFTPADVAKISPSAWLGGPSLCDSGTTPFDDVVVLIDSSPVVVRTPCFEALPDATVLLQSRPAVNASKSALPGVTRPRAPPL